MGFLKLLLFKYNFPCFEIRLVTVFVSIVLDFTVAIIYLSLSSSIIILLGASSSYIRKTFSIPLIIKYPLGSHSHSF